MTSRFAATALLSLLAATTLQAGSRTARMALPSDLGTDAQILTVKSSNFWRPHPGSFGEFEIKDFSRGWKRYRDRNSPAGPVFVAASLGIDATSRESKDKFSYTVYESGEIRAAANCEHHQASESVEVRGVPVSASSSGALRCTIMFPDESPSWELSLDSYGNLRSFRANSGGSLTNGEEKIDIQSVNKMQGSNFRIPAPIGFTLSTADDRTIAAVEVFNKGAVILPATAKPAERVVTAATAVALIMSVDE
jgi:hypothetical protein